jgi:hypothetical protein
MGATSDYFRPLLCFNSRHWQQSVLPLYRELLRRYGQGTGAVILFLENPARTICYPSFHTNCMSLFGFSTRMP